MGNCQSSNPPPSQKPGAGKKPVNRPQSPPNQKPSNVNGQKTSNTTDSKTDGGSPRAVVVEPVANGSGKPPISPKVSTPPPAAPTQSANPNTVTVTSEVMPPPPPANTTDSAAAVALSPSHKKGRLDAGDEVLKLLAISKIQKQARRKSAIKAAQAEVQWKLFADLDTHDEAEMLSLAVFMQTLLDIIPNEGKATGIFSKVERTDTLKMLMKDEDDFTDLNGKDEEEDTFLLLKNVNFTHATGSKRMHSMILTKHHDYDFNHMNLDPHLVTLVVDAFRTGKKLSKNSVVKVLRRVYKSIITMKNVTHMSIDHISKITVVGDLHGQLNDLLHILDEAGLPNENNKFIFNGDFVDRGRHGFEVVFLIFLLYAVYGPTVIAFNRGNHEDSSVCRVYGFEEEVLGKYDELMYEMFAEIFNNLPLFTVINHSIFVVHGGLFHEPKVTLEELDNIPRTEYVVKPVIPYPQNLNGLNEEGCYREYLKQLQRDALWSDPIADKGCFLNHRGAGIVFGPDIAKEFMQLNRLSMVIRSHECVYRGLECPYLPNEAMDEAFHVLDRYSNVDLSTCAIPLLVTLFSASNYTDGDNFGATLQFYAHPVRQGRRVGQTELYYTVNKYRMTHTASKKIVESNKTSLKELILKKKTALVSAFEALDVQNCGLVTRLEWAEVMQQVTLIKILWLSILPTIAPPECLTPTSVNYRLFLESYSDKAATPRFAEHGQGGGATDKQSDSAIDDFYGQRKKLETVFYFFDTNGDGVISAEEFRTGCDLINKSLPPDCQLKNIDRMLQLMDFDGSGSIDINEFFETFRILDAKDGKVDGVISLAKGNH